MNCPPLNGLLDYSQQVLPQNERAGIESHLVTGCRQCAENLHWLSEVAWLTAQDRSFDFAEETLRGLTVWFQEQTVRPPRTLRRLVARLVFDSLLPQQLAPVRSETHHPDVAPLAAGRQMLFQADGYDVDLRFEAIEDLATEDLLGQVLPQEAALPDIAGARVALCQAEQELQRAQTDQRGLFRFAQVPSGVYELKIQVSEGEIELNHVPTARAV
jgi:hypothetical protein